MDYQNTKIYYDGSHYIGIPQGAYPSGKGCKRRAVITAVRTPKKKNGCIATTEKR